MIEPSTAYLTFKAKVLCGAARLAARQRDVEQAIILSEKSITPCKELGEAGKHGMAWALTTLGFVSGDVRPLEESLALLREIENSSGIVEVLNMLSLNTVSYKRALELNYESLAISRKMGNKEGIAWSLFHIGVIALFQGDYDQATALFGESLNLFREVSNDYGMAAVYCQMGQVTWFQGNYERASMLLTESQAFFQKVEDKQTFSEIAIFLGLIAHDQGDAKRALILIEEGLALLQKLGDKLGTAAALGNLGKIVLTQKDVGQATKLYKESLILCRGYGGQSERENMRVINVNVFCLAGLANVASLQGQAQRATCLLGAIETHLETLETMDVLLWPPDRSYYEQTIAAVRAEVDEATFSAAQAEGRAMTLEQAVAYALEEGPLRETDDG